MENPQGYLNQPPKLPKPRPDYLSSSRKRLVPQLLYKGSILKSWGKKQAVALHSQFFETLPILEEVDPKEADMVWLIYDLDIQQNQYQLKLSRSVFTLFEPSLERIITPDAGSLNKFIDHLQRRLDSKIQTDDLI